METKLLDEIIACLPKERTLFHYARNDYALMLLSRAVGKGMRISKLKESSFGRLLNNPAVQNLLTGVGSGYLSSDLFDCAYVKERQNFLLTVGRWNDGRRSYNQTTCNSVNLALQLNFNSGHDCEFERLLGESKHERFEYLEHPILKKGDRTYDRRTMAWIRMDVDFDADEVLIEEIQTDWLRYAKRYMRRLGRCESCNSACDKKESNLKTLHALKSYLEKTLRPYCQMWDEAALTAAINFVTDELGISTIYYHTFDTGNVLKGLRWSQPPKSLYTELPKKFCFELTNEVPKLFGKSTAAKRKLRKAKNPHWYRLNMEALQ